MSDELDKFVLAYTVEIKDSISRLENLQKKVEGVQKASGGAGSEIKKFASGAANELGRLVPGVNAVTAAVGGMAASFGAATVALAGLAAAVTSVIALRDKYNTQRQTGIDVGVSGLRLEEYQRKLLKSGGGYTSRESISKFVSDFRGKASSAYADPTRMSPETQAFARFLGVDVGKPGQKPASMNELMTQFGTRLQGMSPEDAQGLAKRFGFDPNVVAALQRVGPSIGTVTELTPEDISRRQGAQKNVDELNANIAQTKEEFQKLVEYLGQEVIPGFNKLLEAINKILGAVPNFMKSDTGRAVKNATPWVAGGPLLWYNLFKKGGRGREEWNKVFDPEEGKRQEAARLAKEKDESEKRARENAPKTPEQAAIDQKKINELIDAEDKANVTAQGTADQMALAVNMFAGSVQSFTSAISLQQAWAAWAGQVGKAAGLGKDQPRTTMTGTRIVASGPGAKTQYDDIFDRAAAKYNVPVSLLKGIGKVESGYNPNAVSGAGAVGVMQIMPSNFKSLGITDPTDPTQNIMGGAQLFNEYLRAANGDVETALKMYHGGYRRSGWGAYTNSYPGKVLAAAGARKVGNAVRGESRDTMNLRDTQSNIANYLGVPLEQVQGGGVTKGDAAWALSQKEAGITNRLNQLKVEANAPNMPQSYYAGIQQEFQQQSRGLSLLKQFGPGVVDRQAEGGRSLTIGERAIVININGAQDPKAIADQVNNALHSGLRDLNNNYSSGLQS